MRPLSACPVRPVLTISYCASSRRPPAYPEVTSVTPLTRSNTASTPQKQPPASTATADCPVAPGAASTAGGGTCAADSAHPAKASATRQTPVDHNTEGFIALFSPLRICLS